MGQKWRVINCNRYGTAVNGTSITPVFVSVRSVVVLSLHQNGLSIGQSAVFGTCGPARRADTGLNVPCIYPHRKSSLI